MDSNLGMAVDARAAGRVRLKGLHLTGTAKGTRRRTATAIQTQNRTRAETWWRSTDLRARKTKIRHDIFHYASTTSLKIGSKAFISYFSSPSVAAPTRGFHPE